MRKKEEIERSTKNKQTTTTMMMKPEEEEEKRLFFAVPPTMSDRVMSLNVPAERVQKRFILPPKFRCPFQEEDSQHPLG